MKKIIAIAILATVIFSGISFATDSESPQVPPCPEEYRDGLQP